MKKIEKLFVCVGAQKAGTTWLYEVLAKDNQLKMPLFRKEIQYFNYKHLNSPFINQWRAYWLTCLAKEEGFREVLVNYLHKDVNKNRQMSAKQKALFRQIGFCLRPLDDRWYCDYMSVGSKKTCAVDVSPEYAPIGKAGFENIAAVANQLKLVFILRDPVERSWSAMIQELKHLPNAKEQLEQLGAATIEELVNRTKTPSIYKRSDYLTTLKAIKAAGLSDSLKIIFYDDIVNNPAQVIDDIYAHIEVARPNFQNEVIEQVVHKSPTVVMPEQFMTQMCKVYAPMLAQMDSELVSLPDSWKSRYGI